MDNASKLIVYRAQVENVCSLQAGLKQVHRLVNSSLRRNDAAQTEHLTKIYALMFCTWAEANFLKVIHTPHGLELDELRQIRDAKRSNIAAGWRMAVELGLRHLSANRGSFKPNTRKKLDALVETHVVDPSVLRNRLAHGQWVIALNRDNDGVSVGLTAEISSLDLVKISGWLEVHRLLAELVETLLESPRRTFMPDWWTYVVELSAKMDNAKRRTLGDHIALLKAKDARTGASGKRNLDDAARPDP